MSTTFQVYTPTTVIPSFNDVLSLSNRYVDEALKKHGIDKHFTIDVLMMKTMTNDLVDFDKTNPAKWLKEDEYAWFHITGQPGGCDAYCYHMNDYFPDDYSAVDCWNEEMVLNARAKAIEPKIRKCLETGFYWSFRRSAGQLAITNLSYGLIAAAFAELTQGFIFSDDGAWDYNMLPADSKSFLQNYFNPEYPILEHASWANECIDAIKRM